MRTNTWIHILVVIIILSLIIRFAGFILVSAARFWYITVPLILYIMLRSSGKKVKDEKNDKIEDADFEILDDEDEEEK